MGLGGEEEKVTSKKIRREGEREHRGGQAVHKRQGRKRRRRRSFSGVYKREVIQERMDG